LTQYTDYFPGMTEVDVFQSGRDGFTRGWKNIPPYFIAAERPRSESFIGYATIWMNGWKYQKSLGGQQSEAHEID
jgi:hypothetical protein